MHTCDGLNFTKIIQDRGLIGIIKSDDFLAQWSENLLTETAKNHGFTLKTKLDDSCDLHALYHEIKHQDLFQAPCCYRINLNQPTTWQHDQLFGIIQAITSQSQHKLIIQLNKPTTTISKQKAFALLKKNAFLIDTKTLNSSQIQRWLTMNQNHLGIHMQPQATQYLMKTCEQQPLALWQCLKQLEYLTPKNAQVLTLNEIKPYCTQSAHQTPAYQITQALLSGQVKTLAQYLATIQRAEDLHMPYWMTLKQLRACLVYKEKQVAQSLTINQVLQNAQMWPKQKTTMAKALKPNIKTLQDHYIALCQLEWAIKGLNPVDFVSTLKQQLGTLCQVIAHA